MQSANSLGSRATRNRHPVHHPEQRREEAANQTCRNQPIRRPRRITSEGGGRKEMNKVEHDRGCKQPEREHDEHLMNRVTEELRLAFHGRTSASTPYGK
nr:hypothetical protein [Propionivibrio soli]